MNGIRHHTYLLRVWSETDHGRAPAFRAALTDVTTQETRYFDEAEALAVHLKTLHRDAPDGGGRTT